MFVRILNATLFEEGFSATGVNSPCLQILLIHTKHKTIKQYLGLTPLLHFLDGALIHWVDKAMCYQQSGCCPYNWLVRYSPQSFAILAETIQLRYSPCTLEFKLEQWTWFMPNKKTIRWNLDQPHVLISFIHWVDWTVKRATNSPTVTHKSWMVRCSRFLAEAISLINMLKYIPNLNHCRKFVLGFLLPRMSLFLLRKTFWIWQWS